MTGGYSFFSLPQKIINWFTDKNVIKNNEILIEKIIDVKKLSSKQIYIVYKAKQEVYNNNNNLEDSATTIK